MSETRERTMVEREPEAVTSSARAVSRPVEVATAIVDDAHPGVRFYEFSDRSSTMAIDGSWVSAVFESLEAAKSWVGDSIEAERVFRANDRKPIGRRP